MGQKYAKIIPRRDTARNWNLFNPVLLDGEMGIEVPDSGTGTGQVKLKFGDGVTPWNLLPYGVDATEADSIHGGTVSDYKEVCLRAGTHEEWMTSDPVLELGEIVFDISYCSLKAGDGVHKFSELNYINYQPDPDIDWDFGELQDDPNESENDVDLGELSDNNGS